MSTVGQQLMEFNRSLSEQQKVRGGALLIAVGTLLITLLVFVPLATALQILLGLISVALIVAGTLSLGTSGITGRAV
jgi:cobalamin biosynthesis protein CobD/CbiB